MKVWVDDLVLWHEDLMLDSQWCVILSFTPPEGFELNNFDYTKIDTDPANSRTLIKITRLELRLIDD